MSTDLQSLLELNQAIGQAESGGDRTRLESILASQLAFRRANGSVVDRAGFLAGVAAGEPRTTQVDGITVHGDRAVVTCRVTMMVAGVEKRFHNLRLFVREPDGWRLLGWANEAE